MFEKLFEKKEKSKIMMPEELEKLVKPKQSEALKEMPSTKGGKEFYRKEIESINNMIADSQQKGFSTKGLEKRREELERMIGGGHA